MVDEAVGRLVDEPADCVGKVADVGVFNPLISPSLSEERKVIGLSFPHGGEDGNEGDLHDHGSTWSDSL